MFSQLSDKLQDIFKDLRGHGSISEANINDALRQVRLALLEADVHFQVAKDFIAKVKSKALGQEVLRSVTPGQQIVKIFYDELKQLLGGDNRLTAVVIGGISLAVAAALCTIVTEPAAAPNSSPCQGSVSNPAESSV